MSIAMHIFSAIIPLFVVVTQNYALFSGIKYHHNWHEKCNSI